MTAYPIDLGCTLARHRQIGVHAIVNARAGEQWRNDMTDEDWRVWRDARSIRDCLATRLRFYQFNSKFFRRHQARFAHLLSRYDD